MMIVSKSIVTKALLYCEVSIMTVIKILLHYLFNSLCSKKLFFYYELQKSPTISNRPRNRKILFQNGENICRDNVE